MAEWHKKKKIYVIFQLIAGSSVPSTVKKRANKASDIMGLLVMSAISSVYWAGFTLCRLHGSWCGWNSSHLKQTLHWNKLVLLAGPSQSPAVALQSSPASTHNGLLLKPLSTRMRLCSLKCLHVVAWRWESGHALRLPSEPESINVAVRRESFTQTAQWC